MIHTSDYDYVTTFTSIHFTSSEPLVNLNNTCTVLVHTDALTGLELLRSTLFEPDRVTKSVLPYDNKPSHKSQGSDNFVPAGDKHYVI